MQLVKFLSTILTLLAFSFVAGCKQSPPETVTVTREVIVTRIVQEFVIEEGKSVTLLAYEELPPLAGTPSDLLTNTRWQFEKFLFDNVESIEHVNGQWIEFEELTWFGFDACNQVGGGFKINAEGDILLNEGYSTLLLCRDTDFESGEKLSVGDTEFIEALEQSTEFQIQDGKLWLYYSNDRENSLVFLPEVISDN